MCITFRHTIEPDFFPVSLGKHCHPLLPNLRILTARVSHRKTTSAIFVTFSFSPPFAGEQGELYKFAIDSRMCLLPDFITCKSHWGHFEWLDCNSSQAWNVAYEMMNILFALENLTRHVQDFFLGDLGDMWYVPSAKRPRAHYEGKISYPFAPVQ